MVYGLSAWGSEIPDWFTNRNSSDFVTIPLDNEIVSWIGCAMSVGLVLHHDFDLSRDLKVKHVFDCYFHTNGGVRNKQTLFHEINVKDVRFTGPIMYWICIPYLWFLKRCNAFSECTSIKASTVIDSPYVKVEISGNHLLYNLQDFIEFTRAIISSGWAKRIRKNEKNNCGQPMKTAMTEQEREVASLKEQLESLSSDLACYQGQNYLGEKTYVIRGELKHPWTASLLGEFLQEYSIQNDLCYKETFRQFEIPEWFRSVNGSSGIFTIHPSFDAMKGWKGIAVCAAFTVHGLPSLMLEKVEYLSIGYNIGNFILGISVRVFIHTFLTSLKGSGFIWISYASRGSFPKDAPLNECTSMDLIFHSIHKDITVHSCGYQVVFDQNMEELIQTIRQCSTASEDQLSRKRNKQQSDGYYDEDEDVNDDDQDDDDEDDA